MPEDLVKRFDDPPRSFSPLPGVGVEGRTEVLLKVGHLLDVTSVRV